MPGVVREGDECFSGNTKIPLLNGQNIFIKDLVGEKGIYTYSFDPYNMKIVPGYIEKIWRTSKESKCIRIILDNNEVIECTPNHKFYLRDGNLIKASELSIGSSLMPLYRNYDFKYSNKPYEKIMHLNGEWQFTHRMIFEWKYGGNFGKFNTAHHIDYNQQNNDPKNIIAMNFRYHWNFHSRRKSEQLKYLTSEGRHPWQSEKVKKQNSDRMKENNPMFNNENKEKKKLIEIEKYKNGENILKYLNDNDNPMYNEEIIKKMVDTRKSNPLGYHYGHDNPFLSEKVIQSNSKRMKENNPMCRDEVIQKRLDTTAKKYGFKNNYEFVGFIHLEILSRDISLSKLAKEIGCDVSTILSRYDENWISKKNHSVIRIENGYNQEVFNMKVAIYHNYFLTSGILVRNCSGHGCYPERPSSSWSPDVFVNNKAVERYSDTMQPHCCNGICHSGIHVGKHTVYANNLDIQVCGDPIDCGSTCAECSSDVFVDG